MNITLNMLTKVINEDPDRSPIERLLWLSPDQNVIALIDIKSKNALPKIILYQTYLQEINDGLRTEIVEDPYEYYRKIDSDFSTSQIKKREKAWAIIESIVTENSGDLFNRQQRGKLIRETAKQHSCKRDTVYKYLRRYWQRGQMKNALIADYHNSGQNSQNKVGQKKRGRWNSNEVKNNRRYGKPLTPEDEQNIELAIKQYHLVKEKEKGGNKPQFSLKETYNFFFKKYYKRMDFNNGEVIETCLSNIPSETQFRNYYYTKMRNPVDDYIRKNGHLDYLLKHRPKLKNSRDGVSGPLVVLQLDPTPGDIWLVSSLNKRDLVGKPTIYAIVDVYSGAIVMAYAGLKSPSWTEAIKAIEYMVMDKSKLCSKYGIPYYPHEWPCQEQLPQKLLTDGGEFEGFNANILTNIYNVDIDTTASFRGDNKGLVEQILNLIKKEYVYRLPGSGKAKQRTEKDMRLEACIDIHKFRKWLINYIIYYNNYRRQERFPLSSGMIEDNVPPIPMEIWRWGSKNKTYLPTNKLDPKELRQNLLPRATASVTEYGISFRHLLYKREFPKDTGKSEHEQNKWYATASIKGRWHEEVSYDPELVNHIYLWLENEDTPILCTLLNKTGNIAFWNCDWGEVDSEFKRRKSQEIDSLPQTAIQFTDFFESLQDDIKDDISEAENSRRNLSKTQQVANIRENRELEQKIDIQTENIIRNADDKLTDTPPQTPEKSAKPDYIPPHNPTDSIRNARNKSIENQGDDA